MRWRTCVFVAAVSFVVLATASPALAKGPDQATISGPGLTHPIVVGGEGEPGSAGSLGQLSDGSGLFPAMFGPSGFGDQALLAKAPAGPLGPRYTLSYRVPDGTPASTVRQDLYPLAAGGPVTYTRAGQVVFGTSTHGGWYRAPAGFSDLLARIGVPGVVAVAAGAPISSAASSPSPAAAGAAAAQSGGTPAHVAPWMTTAAGVLGGCLVLIAAGIVLTRRRRVAQH